MAARLFEAARRQIAALLGVLAAGDELQPLSLEVALRALELVACDLGRLLALLELPQHLVELTALIVEVGDAAGQTVEALAEVVVLIEREIEAQLPIASVQITEAPRLGGLTANDAQPPLGLLELLADADQVEVAAFELAGGLDLAGLELGDARGFLEDDAAVRRVGGEHGVDAALLDRRVGVRAYAGVHEELFDVAEPAFLAVDQVLAAAVAVEAPGDVHLLAVHAEDAVRGRIVGVRGDLGVVERQGHGGRPQGLAGRRAGEDDVDHRVAAQALGGSLPEDPLDGIDHVGLAAAVGPDDADNRRLEPELGRVCKGLEAGERDLVEPHPAVTSCRPLVRSMNRLRSPGGARRQWRVSSRLGSGGLTLVGGRPSQVVHRGTVASRRPLGLSSGAGAGNAPCRSPPDPAAGLSGMSSGVENSGRSGMVRCSCRTMAARMRSCSALKSALM